jgi:hypothetical protein
LRWSCSGIQSGFAGSSRKIVAQAVCVGGSPLASERVVCVFRRAWLRRKILLFHSRTLQLQLKRFKSALTHLGLNSTLQFWLLV